MKRNQEETSHREHRQNGFQRRRALYVGVLIVGLAWCALTVAVYYHCIDFGVASRFETWTVDFGIFGVLAAGATAAIFWKQLDVMSGQLTTMQEAERAFVAFLDLEVEGTSGGAPLDGTIRAINSGRSPAKILAWTRAFAFISESASEAHPSAAKDSAQTGRILVPGRDMKTDFYIDWPEVLIRGQVLHIFSEVRYTDLRSGAEHLTRVCWQYLGARTGASTRAYCQGYNDAT